VAGPGDERDDREQKGDDEDLFEDLDEFFAPLQEAGWPEGQEAEEEAAPGQVPPTPPQGPGSEGAAEPGSLEDWDVAIEVPEADELLAAPPGTETPEPEEAGVPTPREGLPEPEGEEAVEAALGGEESGAEEEGPLNLDDLQAPPPEYADLPGAEGGEEEAVLPEEEAVTAEELFEGPEGEEEPIAVGGAGVGEAAEEEEEPEQPEAAEEPEAEAVEAAAEHFASGIRETPEEVERELLEDLEEGRTEDETVTIEPGAAAPEGPTWQEAAEPVAEEPAAAAAAPAGRNLTAAFLSGILLAIAVIVLLAIDKGPFVVFAGAVVLLGQAELYAVMRTRRFQPATLLGLVCGGLIIAGAYLRGPSGVTLGLFLAMGLTVLWFMAAPAASRRNTTINAGATILGTVYVPFLASFAILLLTYPGDLGRNVFLVVVGLTILYDVCAYAIGTLWGSRPLAPTISPQKSWEGAIGATFVLLLVALAIVPSIDPFDAPGRAVGLALVIAVAAPLGDLVESALKRDLGVKDMGTVLPGHGGILDRIDAILFAAPAAFWFLQLSF
jgi:phosphatidate cytidylyltransferase